MFTGLVQALGKINSLGGYSYEIICASEGKDLVLRDLAIGDSVAVDGVCLTVVEILPQGFVAAASPETLRRTTLGERQMDGGYVNLETSLRVGSKLGGHFVMGHVDGVGSLQALEQTATSWEMSFKTTEAIARYIVPKGSIAINGVSLTIADYEPAQNWFKAAVIPHTYEYTNLRYLLPGSLVNLEADILGKYVEKLIGFNRNHSAPEELTAAFLAENGYL